MRWIPRSVVATLALLLFTGITAAQEQDPEEIAMAADELSTTVVLGVTLGVMALYVVIAALLIHVGTDYTRSTERYARTEPITTGLIGFGLTVGIFIVSFLLILTFIGAIIGLPLLFGFLFVFLTGQVIAEIALGHGVLRNVGDRDESRPSVKTLWLGFLIGFAIVFLAGVVPVIGGLIGFFLALAVGSIGIGTMVQHYRKGSALREPGEQPADAQWGAEGSTSAGSGVGDSDSWGESSDSWDEAGSEWETSDDDWESSEDGWNDRDGWDDDSREDDRRDDSRKDDW